MLGFYTLREMKTSALFHNLPVYFLSLSVPVLRIWDVYPGSLILIFIYPGSRIQQQQQWRRKKKYEPIDKKNYGTFYPKKLSLSSQNMGKNLSRI
jgi:hypothetical protein